MFIAMNKQMVAVSIGQKDPKRNIGKLHTDLEMEYLRNKQEIDRKIEALFKWDMSKVKMYLVVREKMSEKEAEERIIEYRRFISIHFLVKKPVPVSQPVDTVWHTHILFTEDYCSMGSKVIGRYFHHHPTLNDSEREGLKNEYDQTIVAYTVLFGKPDEKYWPESSQVCKCCSPCTCPAND